MNIENNIQQQYEKFGNVQGLMKFVTEEALEEAYNNMEADKATGFDRVTKKMYGKHLKRNIHNLYIRLKSGTYQPQPVLRAEIPKSNKETRKLGLPIFEDKLVQWVFTKILNAIYEPLFLDNSYGYRPKRNGHQALSQLNFAIQDGATYIVDTDIRKFFDNVNHKILIDLLEQIIQDKHFIKYIYKFLKGGVMIKGNNKPDPTEQGTPQRTD